MKEPSGKLPGAGRGPDGRRLAVGSVQLDAAGAAEGLAAMAPGEAEGLGLADSSAGWPAETGAHAASAVPRASARTGPSLRARVDLSMDRSPFTTAMGSGVVLLDARLQAAEDEQED